MRMYDVIRKKRDGGELSSSEIRFFIEGYVGGSIPDYQVSALMMAIYFRGMTEAETLELTRTMIESGDTINLSSIPGLKVDKHSTGGVGDKTSIILGPLVAAAGIPVPKLSGRGLGHTGGTLDKLESIPGFRTNLGLDEIVKQVKEIGIAIAGQTQNLVPADKLLYALRDVTATVEDFSLIAASIMSKKLAGGADRIVLDVKCGSGAFMKTLPDARRLAEELVTIGAGMGRKTTAFITSMAQPLGLTVGNSLEIREAIDVLRGEGPADLRELCLELGSRMLFVAEAAPDIPSARARLESLIASGKALDKLRDLIIAQGGNPAVTNDPNLLVRSRLSVTLKSKENGYISSIDTEGVGIAAMLSGAGRETKDMQIDLGAGLVLHKKIGDYCETGTAIATVYADDDRKLNNAVRHLSGCYTYSAAPVEVPELIISVIEDDFTPLSRATQDQPLTNRR